MATSQNLLNKQFNLFLIILGLSLPVSVFGGLGVAFFCAAASLVALLTATRLKSHVMLTRYFFLTASICILFFWSLTSLAWTLNEKKSISIFIQVFLLIFSGIYLLLFSAHIHNEEKQLKLAKSVSVLLIASITLFVFEIYSGGLIIGFIKGRLYRIEGYIPKLADMNRSISYISLIFWGLFAFWWEKKRNIAAVLALIVAVAVLSSISLSAKMGFVVGLGVFALTKKYQQKSYIILIAAIALITVLFPIINLYTHPQIMEETKLLPLSSLHRMFIWQFVDIQFLEKPWRGWGFDASPYIPGGSDLVLDGKYNDDWRYLPRHPHNNILQMLLELGVLGGVLLVAIFSSMFYYIRKSELPAVYKASFAALVMNYFVIGLTAFGVWQFWWIGAGILAGANLVALARKPWIHEPASALAS